MKMKANTLALTLMLTASCASVGGMQSGHQILKEAAVKEVIKPSVYSGVIASYVELEIFKGGKSMMLLYPYFEDDTALPSVGSHCDFQYEVQEVEGQVGGRFLKRQTAKVIRTFDCDYEEKKKRGQSKLAFESE